MKVVEIQFTPWGKSYDFNGEDSALKVNDFVIVKTELGTELGKVISTREINDNDPTTAEIKPIFRKANSSDLLKIKERGGQKKEALSFMFHTLAFLFVEAIIIFVILISYNFLVS